MSSEFLGLRTAIYFVPDLPQATEWYTRALGIEPYFNEPFYVGFNVGGYELGLHPLVEGKESAEGSVHTYWGVHDVQATFDRLLGMGATAFETPNEVGGGIVVGAVKDPWGNVFGFIYNPHFVL
jgi:catechol 2,3-dioxygenase-like lactoylglutathione lyase family enzyme